MPTKVLLESPTICFRETNFCLCVADVLGKMKMHARKWRKDSVTAQICYHFREKMQMQAKTINWKRIGENTLKWRVQQEFALANKHSAILRLEKLHENPYKNMKNRFGEIVFNSLHMACKPMHVGCMFVVQRSSTVYRHFQESFCQVDYTKGKLLTLFTEE